MKRVAAVRVCLLPSFPELSFELFQYWVGKAQELNARVPSDEWLQHTSTLYRVATEAVERQLAAGEEVEHVDRCCVGADSGVWRYGQ